MNVNQKLEKCTNEIELKNTISNEECTRILDSEGEGQGGMIWENGIETCILSCKKRIASLCPMQNAWGWCMGMTQRDVMGREVGGGFMFGNTCTPMVDSCQCMAKPIQYCKVK